MDYVLAGLRTLGWIAATFFIGGIAILFATFVIPWVFDNAHIVALSVGIIALFALLASIFREELKEVRKHRVRREAKNNS